MTITYIYSILFCHWFAIFINGTRLEAAMNIYSPIFIFSVAVLVSACTATRVIEETPVSDEEPFSEGTAATYPEEIAGTVQDLYGDDSVLDDNVVYQEAVIQEPSLRYNIIYFDFNRVDIRPESSELIQRHAAYLQRSPHVFVILEGHADNRGSEGYNLALGERRAQAVADVLKSSGVPGSQLSVISFGEEKPAVFGNDEIAFSKNRRVEIVYH